MDYQNHRKAEGISNRTINMDVGVLRQMLKRAKRWKFLNDDVKPLPENTGAPKDVLTAEQKALLFQTAGSKPAMGSGLLRSSVGREHHLSKR